jgi:regulatory protein
VEWQRRNRAAPPSNRGAAVVRNGSAREAALKLLDRQRRTRIDLGRRLKEKGFDAAEIEATLDRLAEVGLIDDVEYARAFIAGRWGRRAAGWRRIEQDLRGRGVSADDIGEARRRFEEAEGAADETAAAQKVVQQSERRYGALDPRARRQRLTALLLRRGFSYDTIEQVLKATRVAD